MVCREQGDERMRTICLKTPLGVDLLHAILTINGRDLEFCGLADQKYKDGLLWQWWIVMDV